MAATLLAAGILAAAAPLFAAKPRVVTSQAVPERTHHLYVGVELYLPHDNEMKKVRSIDARQTWLAGEDGSPAAIDRTSGYRWKLVPKVSNESVAVTGLKWETTYSPRNNPRREWAGRQTNLMNYQQDQLNQAAFSAVTLAQSLSGSTPPGGEFPSDTAALQQASIDNIERVADQGAMIDRMTDADFGQREIEHRQATQAPDALQLQFAVASPQPLADAYYVALARVRTPDGRIQDINFHKALGEVGPNPRRITHLQTGIPPGSEILEVKLHLFNRGKELATNLSEKRFELTEDEAHQYLLLDHTSNHRGETVPARPVWELAPPALVVASGPAAFSGPLSVQVDAEGRFAGFASTAEIVAANQREIVEQLVFLPALRDGEPIASTVVLDLADYFR